MLLEPCNFAPTVNLTVLAAAISISSPVRGLRPVRAARWPADQDNALTTLVISRLSFGTDRTIACRRWCKLTAVPVLADLLCWFALTYADGVDLTDHE
jgi:hypothetical protein